MKSQTMKETIQGKKKHRKKEERKVFNIKQILTIFKLEEEREISLMSP